LLKLQRRWASVVAVGRVRLIALSADDLAEMSEQMPELADRLRETVTRRERENETY
jgi:CRP-like cAMP-binding protein